MGRSFAVYGATSAGSGGGGGVIQVNTSSPLTGGPITSSGTIGLNTALIANSVNGIKGDIFLTAGSNVTVTPSGSTIEISATGGGGGSGTVTSITFNSPLTGGTITTSGSAGFNASAVPLDTLGATTDITTLNATASAHGLLPKLSNDASHALRGNGTWSDVAYTDLTGTPVVDSIKPSSTSSGFSIQNHAGSSVAVFGAGGSSSVTVSLTDGLTSGGTVTSKGLTVKDGTDDTKAVTLNVSGVSTGTTRTLTVPNASGTIALTSDAKVDSLNALTGALTLVAGSNVTVTPSGSTITIASSGSGGGGVESLNALTGALTLVQGANVTITPSGSTITIASSASGGSSTKVQINASAARSSITSGADFGVVQTTAGNPDLITMDFDAGTEEFIQFSIPYNTGWSSGIKAKFFWSHAATTTNFDVVWKMQALAVSNDDTMEAAFSGGVTVTDTGGTTNDLYVSGLTGTLTISGTPADGDLIFFRVSRDATAGGDTLAIDARLHYIEVDAA